MAVLRRSASLYHVAPCHMCWRVWLVRSCHILSTRWTVIPQPSIPVLHIPSVLSRVVQYSNDHSCYLFCCCCCCFSHPLCYWCPKQRANPISVSYTTFMKCWSAKQQSVCFSMQWTSPVIQQQEWLIYMMVGPPTTIKETTHKLQLTCANTDLWQQHSTLTAVTTRVVCKNDRWVPVWSDICLSEMPCL